MKVSAEALNVNVRVINHFLGNVFLGIILKHGNQNESVNMSVPGTVHLADICGVSRKTATQRG